MSANFDQAYFFGDSLSDTGNFSNFSGGAFPIPPFAPGRFSNGDVWVDYLAEDLSLDLNLFSTGFDVQDGVNYAVGGATSSNDNGSFVPVGLTQQMDAFELLVENQSPGEVRDDDLFFLWIGANDYFSFIEDDPNTPDVIETNFPQTGKDINNAVLEVVDLNIGGAVQDIIDAGGENIVIFNLPDLEKTPLAQSLTKEDQKQLKKLTDKHNKNLDKLVAQTEASNPDVNIIEIDVNDLFNDIIKNPNQFGLTNVTDNYTGIDIYTGITQPPAGGDPNQYLFWDSVHPTTKVHDLVADLVTNELTNEGLII
jgi:phospholipase/lecithinase/hemolysin